MNGPTLVIIWTARIGLRVCCFIFSFGFFCFSEKMLERGKKVEVNMGGHREKNGAKYIL